MQTLAALVEVLRAGRSPILAASYGAQRNEMTLHVCARDMGRLDLKAIEQARRERAVSARLVLRIHADAQRLRREEWNAFLASTRDEAVLLDTQGWLARAALVRKAADGIFASLGAVVADIGFHVAAQTLWVVLDRAASLPELEPTVRAALYFSLGEADWPHVRLRVCKDQPPAGAVRMVRGAPV